MPHVGFTDPVTNDRAIEASVVSLAPPIVETKDGVTYET